MNFLYKIKSTVIIFILRMICKYYIAFQMFDYAFAKILKSQFDMGITYKIDYLISDLNGFTLTWIYYGYSRTYGLVIAGLQILSGILLLFKKTERIGIIIFLSFMINILLVNYFYEIDGAKSMSIRLVIMGLFLLLSDWKALIKYLFLIKNTIIDNPLKNIKYLNSLSWLKIIIIPLMIFYGYNNIADIKKNFLVKNKLYGVWRSIDRETTKSISKLYFDYDNKFKLKDDRKNMYYGKIEIDSLNKTLKLNAEHSSEELRFFLKDSLSQIKDLPKKDSLISLKKRIINFYYSENNTKPINSSYNFYVKRDTLFLRNDTNKFKFLNISKDYKL